MQKLTRDDLTGTTATRFWKYVAKGKDDECWPWLGVRRREWRSKQGFAVSGYGRLEVAHSKRGRVYIDAHRISYALFVGDIPAGFHVRHTCDNPRCVNPAHLRLGTPHENTMDSVKQFRHARQIDKERRDRIVQAYQRGMPIQEIRSCYNVGKTSVYEILNQSGVRSPRVTAK